MPSLKRAVFGMRPHPFEFGWTAILVLPHPLPLPLRLHLLSGLHSMEVPMGFPILDGRAAAAAAADSAAVRRAPLPCSVWREETGTRREPSRSPIQRQCQLTKQTRALLTALRRRAAFQVASRASSSWPTLDLRGECFASHAATLAAHQFGLKIKQLKCCCQTLAPTDAVRATAAAKRAPPKQLARDGEMQSTSGLTMIPMMMMTTKMTMAQHEPAWWLSTGRAQSSCSGGNQEPSLTRTTRRSRARTNAATILL
jgi:hypothetical protein